MRDTLLGAIAEGVVPDVLDKSIPKLLIDRLMNVDALQVQTDLDSRQLTVYRLGILSCS